MTIVSTDAGGNLSDAEYRDYLSRVQARFVKNVTDNAGVLFTTDADGLFDAFMDALPEHERPFHQCHACRHFINRFGGLVTIDEQGRTASAVWDVKDVYDLYRAPVEAMLKLVKKAKITGVFLCSDKTWGTPTTGAWCHFGLVPPKELVYRSLTKTAGQAMAEKREDYKNVSVALGEYSIEALDAAVRLLESDALYRSESVLGAAKWLRDAYSVRKALGTNALWRIVALAPAGFCHPRSSMIGTLLDDLAAGKDFDAVSRAFKAKMHPLQYQRPQAAPSAGTIAQAEKVVAQMGAAGSLRRRFASLNEVLPYALWMARSVELDKAKEGGVFAHLKPKNRASIAQMDLPPKPMTWEKFSRDVLPAADRIELRLPTQGNYSTLVTAADMDAPPIIQWDSVEARNPFTWYVWHGGSPASQYGLTGGAYVDVAGICLKPNAWGESKATHHGEGVILLVDNAKETRQAGAAIFPEFLKAEFHGIRSVVEAYSKSARIEEIDEPHAIGLMLHKGQTWTDAHIRVTANGHTAVYDLDRWE